LLVNGDPRDAGDTPTLNAKCWTARVLATSGKLSEVTGQFLLVFGVLLVFANAALGEGTYQRTRNGKTLVWNNHPKPADEATWSGARDQEGYARGLGTLTWYKKQSLFARLTLYARYFGNMDAGKFNGPVTVHSRRKTFHAIFADGVRTTRWTTGPASSQAYAQWRTAMAGQNIEPEPPGQGPSLTGENAQPSEHWSESGVDDSLQLLVRPPRFLRLRSAGARSGPPFANARLTKEEVVDLADAAARARGYAFTEYARPEPQYDPADQIWLLAYDQKLIGKHFIVAVGDRSKRTTILESTK